MTKYGKNLIVVITNDEKGVTKQNLFNSVYPAFYCGKRQTWKKERDWGQIMSLPGDKKYKVVKRQWTGHLNKPSKVRIDGKLHEPVFVSNVIEWN